MCTKQVQAVQSLWPFSSWSGHWKKELKKEEVHRTIHHESEKSPINFVGLWTEKCILKENCCLVPYEPFLYRERLLQQNGDRRKRDRREYCTYPKCSWKQDIMWLVASPPLTLWLDNRRQLVSWHHFSSPLLTSPPPHTPTPLGQFLTASPYLEDGL